MLIGVINGYYRSGTTVWQLAIERANDDIVCIHEPHSPVAPIELQGHKYLHGWDVYRGYRKLPTSVLREYLRTAMMQSLTGVITKWDDAKAILDVFHDAREDVIVKSCQLHFFLDKIEDYYGCWAIHIEREIPWNIYAHVEIYPNEHFRRRVLLSPSYNDCFFVDSVHKSLCRFFNESPKSNVIEKLIYNIQKCNDVNAVKVKFEDPEKVAKVIPLSVDTSVIDVSKIKPNLPRWFLEVIECF